MKVHYPKLYNMAHLLSLNVLLLPKDLTIIFYLLLLQLVLEAVNIYFFLSYERLGFCRHFVIFCRELWYILHRYY